MIITTQHERLLTGWAHLSLQWEGVGGAGERSGYNRVIIQVGCCGSIAVIPSEPLSEVNSEQTVDDWVQAGVNKPEDEQDVGQ